MVSFQEYGESYALFVDEQDVQGGLFTVYKVAQCGDEVLVDLPRETFTSGNRVRVSIAAL